MNQATNRKTPATYTIRGNPRTRSVRRDRNTSSSMRIRSPPVIIMASPVPTKPIASEAMKDGILSLTWISPLTKPRAAPTSIATGNANQAQLAKALPSHRKQNAKETAQTYTVPSIDRSIEPMIMTNVTPVATMSAGDAAIRIRAKFRVEKNRGSITAKKPQSAIRTRSGAHFTRVSRPIPTPLPALSAVCIVAKVLPPKALSHQRAGNERLAIPAGRGARLANTLITCRRWARSTAPRNPPSHRSARCPGSLP